MQHSKFLETLRASGLQPSPAYQAQAAAPPPPPGLGAQAAMAGQAIAGQAGQLAQGVGDAYKQGGLAGAAMNVAGQAASGIGQLASAARPMAHDLANTAVNTLYGPQAAGKLQALGSSSLPLGASAGGQALAAPAPAPTPAPAAQPAKPEPMMTAPDQAAANIQSRSQSTPAANVGTAPGKQPESGGFGVSGYAKMGDQEYKIGPTGQAEKFVGGVSQGDPAKASFTQAEHEKGRIADEQRNQQTLADNARFRADTSYQAGILKAGEYRDPMQRAMMMKAAGDQYGAAVQGLMTPEKQAQLGIQQQQADAQTTNAGANMKQADAQMENAKRPAEPKTDMRNVKAPSGQQNPKTREPYYEELQVAYNPDGSPTAASAQALQSYFQTQEARKLQSEQDSRSMLNPMNWLRQDLSPEEIQAQAAEQARPMTARYGVQAQAQQAQQQMGRGVNGEQFGIIIGPDGRPMKVLQ